MEIKNTEEFLRYYGRIRQRTSRVVACIPPTQIDWTYAEGRFTFGDIVRHVAAIERYMFAENAKLRPSRYPGHDRSLADGYEEVVRFFERTHQESMEIFGGLSHTELEQHCTTPGGAKVPVWKWLRAMLEHEIHHRGQLYVYLALMGVAAPPLYGLTSEEVRAKSI